MRSVKVKSVTFMMTTEKMSDIVRFMVKQRGITQTVLSEESGYSRCNINCWISGKTCPRFTSLRKICDICNAEILLNGVPFTNDHYMGHDRISSALTAARNSGEIFSVRVLVPDGDRYIRKLYRKGTVEKGEAKNAVL